MNARSQQRIDARPGAVVYGLGAEAARVMSGVTFCLTGCPKSKRRLNATKKILVQYLGAGQVFAPLQTISRSMPDTPHGKLYDPQLPHGRLGLTLQSPHFDGHPFDIHFCHQDDDTNSTFWIAILKAPSGASLAHNFSNLGQYSGDVAQPATPEPD
jgi:hypothetical protein